MSNNINISDYLNSDQLKERLSNILKSEDKRDLFITSVVSLVNSNESLKDVDKSTLLNACLIATSMNLPVNQNLGFAYIIPYKGKAQFQMGYKGFIQLAMRSGEFKTISSTPIYEGQLIGTNPLTGYQFDFNVKSDKVIGYAGYFQLINGFEKTLYMTVEELKKHGMNYSQTYKKDYGLWKDNFDAMASKTVLKLLLSKYAPLSIDMQRAVRTDQGIIKDENGENVDYIDNRILTLEENNRELEIERLKIWIENSDTLEKLKQANTAVYTLAEDNLINLYEQKQNELQQL